MEKLIGILGDVDEQSLLSDNQIDLIAKRFKILSEASRLKILRSLFGGERTVSEIIDITGLLQANVSKQLSILLRNGIVACRPEGLLRYYKITDFTIEKICHAVCGNYKN
jgi:DNA-binding transcriptional ArsR family regulator